VGRRGFGNFVDSFLGLGVQIGLWGCGSGCYYRWFFCLYRVGTIIARAESTGSAVWPRRGAGKDAEFCAAQYNEEYGFRETFSKIGSL
jgi:hypothetical protein